jgi:hypothetical protein
MKTQEAITGVLGFICLLSFSAGVGTIVLYNRGDVFSLIVVFITVFSTPFFFSSIKNKHEYFDDFIDNIFVGTLAVIVCALGLLGTSDTLYFFVCLSIWSCSIFKITRGSEKSGK